SRAPRSGPAEREAGGRLPDAGAVERPAGGGLRSTRRGIHHRSRVVIIIIILVATATLAASYRPDQGEAEGHEPCFPKCVHWSSQCPASTAALRPRSTSGSGPSAQKWM